MILNVNYYYGNVEKLFTFYLLIPYNKNMACSNLECYC